MLYTVSKKSSFYFGGNNCQFLSNDRLCEVGLIVHCIICDQGATNMAAVKNLGCTGNNVSFTRPSRI